VVGGEQEVQRRDQEDNKLNFDTIMGADPNFVLETLARAILTAERVAKVAEASGVSSVAMTPVFVALRTAARAVEDARRETWR